MPSQNINNTDTINCEKMEPSGGLVTNNSHQELMSDCECESVDLPLAQSQNTLKGDDKYGFGDVSKREWLTVIILCFVNLINYMDRFTVAGVLPDVQGTFNINYRDAGLLQTAFVLSYMVFAPLFGYLGDRYNRKYIMGFGVFLWSLTTFVGSFMPDYWSFMLFRALVGIGEASYSTIAPTIISDMFVKDIRSKMLALFYFAIPVGSGLGYIVGSETAKMAGDWRWGLRVTPFLGAIAVLLIIFVMQEPERGQAEGSTELEHTSWWKDIKELSFNPSFMLSTAGFTCVAFVAGALAWWGPTCIFYGLQEQGNTSVTMNDVSYKFGLVAMFAGLIGVPTGSLLAQRLRPRYADIDPLICAFGLLVSAPLVYLALVTARTSSGTAFFFMFLAELSLNMSCVSFVFGVVTMIAGLLGVPLGSYLGSTFKERYPRIDAIICAGGLFISAPLIIVGMLTIKIDATLCLILIFFGELALNLNWALVADMLLYVVIPTRRSTAEAFQILISHALGDAGSPYLIGVISDALKNRVNPDCNNMVDDAKAAERLVETFATPCNESYEFKSLQYALFTTTFVEVLGGVFFILTAIFIVRDKLHVERVTNEIAQARGGIQVEPADRAPSVSVISVPL